MSDMIDRTFEDNEELESDPTIVTLSSGVIVKARAVPDNLIMKFREKNPPPRPPVVPIEQGGKKWNEENPNDPEYKAELENYQMRIGVAMTDMMLLVGMEILATPKGFVPYEEDDTWEETLEALDLEVPEKPASKKIEWLRLRVAPSMQDIEKLSSAYNKAAGISEEDIETAKGQFRGESSG